MVVRGLAWSGAAPIARVEVSVGDQTWRAATLTGGQHRHGWRAWQLRARVTGPGPVVILARATDTAGRTQPGRAAWNPLGYAANPIHQVVTGVSGAPAEVRTGTNTPSRTPGDPAPVRHRRRRAPHGHQRAGSAEESQQKRATAACGTSRTPQRRPTGPPPAGL